MDATFVNPLRITCNSVYTLLLGQLSLPNALIFTGKFVYTLGMSIPDVDSVLESSLAKGLSDF